MIVVTCTFLKPPFAGVSDTYGRKSILMMPDTVDFIARLAIHVLPLLSATGKPSTNAVRVLVSTCNPISFQ